MTHTVIVLKCVEVGKLVAAIGDLNAHSLWPLIYFYFWLAASSCSSEKFHWCSKKIRLEYEDPRMCLSLYNRLYIYPVPQHLP